MHRRMTSSRLAVRVGEVKNLLRIGGCAVVVLVVGAATLLMSSCGDGSSQKRKLGKDDIPANTPSEGRRLIEQLFSKTADERATAAFGFTPSTMGPPQVRHETLNRSLPAIPFLVDRLDDFASARLPFSRMDTTPAEMALHALTAIGSPAIKPLAGTLKHENPAVRRASVEALGSIEDTEAIPAIVECLKTDRSAAVRRACIYALEILILGGPKASPFPDTSKDPAVVLSAFRKAVCGLRDALQDRDEKVRQLAQDLFAKLENRGVVKETSDDSIRKEVSELRQALQDKDADVRETARDLLMKLEISGILKEIGSNWLPTTEEEETTSATKGRMKEISVDLGGGVTMEFVFIGPGSLLAGDGKEKHQVTLTKPFYMARHEVTQEQWQVIIGDNPSGHKGPKNPVENVSWGDCQQFLAKLNLKLSPSKAASLPTEAQWEYVCRAGRATKLQAGLADYAWCSANSGGSTHPVGTKKPNAWGIYDMLGNVWEWCSDWYDERRDGHVMRGGSCNTTPANATSTYRECRWSPDGRSSDLGFRVVFLGDESSGAEIERMRKDVELRVQEGKRANQKKKETELINARGMASYLLYTTEEASRDMRDKMTPDERKSVEERIVELKKAVEGDDAAAIERATEELRRGLPAAIPDPWKNPRKALP